MRAFLLLLAMSLPALADEDAAPFPPGDGAVLTRKVCTRCHGANLVITKRYDPQSAERYWRTMIGTDPRSAEARKVINYLLTVVSDDSDGPDAALH